MSSVRTCTHIKVSGVRCESPALREQPFCYFHQRMHRGVRTPPRARLHPIALIEDGESVQTALMEVINGLMRNTLDLKRATLILRALHIAVKNANHANFNIHSSDMVKQVPEYDDSEPNYTEDGVRELEIPFEAAYGADPRASKVYRTYKSAEQAARERDETIAHYYGYPTVEAYEAAKKAKEQKQEEKKEDEEEKEENKPSENKLTTSAPAKSIPAHVGTDPSVRSAGPAPGPQLRAAAPSPAPAPAQQDRNKPAAQPAKNAPNSTQQTPRKPPTNVKHVQRATPASTSAAQKGARSG